LPPAIVEIIERAMAKDPRDRFRTINDFIRAVEDCFLPTSPLPRSLTPMAGVPLFPLNEQKSGSMVDSLVPMRGEGSGLNQTLALFALPRDGSDSQPLSPARRTAEAASPATDEIDFDMSIGKRLKKLFLKRGVAPATFVGVVLLVGYFAFPRARRPQAERAPAPAASWVDPASLPEQAPAPSPVPAPAPAAAANPGPGAAVATPESEPELKPTDTIPSVPSLAGAGEHTLPREPRSPEEDSSRSSKSARAARHAAARALAAESEHTVGHVPPAAPATSPRTAPSGSAPRAGSLSSDDF
jgi:hypothetical protein